MLNIRIFDDINDPFLKAEWERLEEESDVFPQSTYHWCSTWWKHLGGNRRLHVVMVLDERDRALAIAPVCIEKNAGIPVLRSFPIHFGDFYSFISSSSDASNLIVDYFESNKAWFWVRMDQVVESNELIHLLNERAYCSKRITGSVLAAFDGLEWDDYLGKLSASFRRNVRNRQRKINAQFDVELVVYNDWKSFAPELEAMHSMHKKRWVDDNVPHKSEKERLCWKEALKAEFDKEQAVYYQLLFSGHPVAYRLGFLKDGTYYDWHTSFDPEYQKYHVGQMSVAYMIRNFMQHGVSQINFMAGEYQWKLDWSPDKAISSHYMYTSPSTNIMATILNWYYHHLRERLRGCYHRMMDNRVLRMVSRNLILLRQKMNGRR